MSRTQATLPERPTSHALFIDGAWSEAADGARFTRESPAHGVTVGEYAEAGAADADRAVAAARRAFEDGNWPRASGRDRAHVLQRVADAVRARSDELAVIEVLESGKPLSQARDEMSTVADLWEYGAALARTVRGDAYSTLSPDLLGLVLRDPIGVVGIITPWNFPLLIVSQKLPFALAAGCTVVVKPSELTPGTTLRLAELLADAGLPPGALNVVTGLGDPVGARLVAHPDVDMISFTGSTAVGKQIVAGAAGTLKKVSLELGGKNPQIVFDDADLQAAVDAVVFGVAFNMGECCNSGSRLLVQRSIAEEFTAAVVDHAATVPVGDPLDERTKVGAIINQAQLDKITRYVAGAQGDGAVVRLGGDRLPAPAGRFFAPTVLAGVEPHMAVAREEVFGPVLAVLPFDDVDQAVAIANDTLYGLSAGVWTADVDRAITSARRIRAGTVWVNTFMDGFPELPFGGFAQSGLGRELGRRAVEDFTEEKTIQIRTGGRPQRWHRPEAAQ